MADLRTGAAVLFFLSVSWLTAEETSQGDSPPQVTISTAYNVTAEGDSLDWSTAQTAEAGLTGRWGQTLRLEARLTAPFDGSALTADALVRQLVLAWAPTSWSVVSFGKQRLKWGSARVLSAIDSLEPVYDPTHPNAVLDGVTGIKAELIPNDWLGLSVLALPAPRALNTKAAVRADLLWDETDLSLGAVTAGSQRSVFADVSRFFDSFGVYAEAQASRLRGKDWSGTDGTNDLGLSSRAEGPWTPRITGGTQTDFPAWLHGTITVLTEYRYDAAGFNAAEAVAFATAWSHRAAGFTPPVGLAAGGFSKHYGFLGVSGIPVAEKVNLGVSTLAGLDTGFVLGRLTGDYAVDQHLWLQLVYTRFDHVPGTEARAGDLVFLEVRDQVTLTVSAAY